jgi:hypothetical protein
MCGGDGGGYSSRSISDIQKEVDRQNERTDYNDAIEAIVKEQLSTSNVRDTDIIDKHIETLLNAIKAEVEESVQVNFGGSVKKHTYVNGISDIDLLLDIKNTKFSDMGPKEAIKAIADIIQNRLPNSKVETGDMSIKLSYSDGSELQLLPAVKTKTGFKIPDPKASTWSSVVKPDTFAKKLTDVNQTNRGMVVPVIKALKGAQDGFSEKYKMTGYHLESLAIEAFEKYKGDYSYQNMITHFCKSIAERVTSPIADKTGQSLHVDDYLGSQNSTSRKAISDNYTRLVNKLNSAQGSCDIETWKEIFSG